MLAVHDSYEVQGILERVATAESGPEFRARVKASQESKKKKGAATLRRKGDEIEQWCDHLRDGAVEFKQGSEEAGGGHKIQGGWSVVDPSKAVNPDDNNGVAVSRYFIIGVDAGMLENLADPCTRHSLLEWHRTSLADDPSLLHYAPSSGSSSSSSKKRSKHTALIRDVGQMVSRAHFTAAASCQAGTAMGNGQKISALESSAASLFGRRVTGVKFKGHGGGMHNGVVQSFKYGKGRRGTELFGVKFDDDTTEDVVLEQSHFDDDAESSWDVFAVVRRGVQLPCV
jgi:hypothetical protein